MAHWKTVLLVDDNEIDHLTAEYLFEDYDPDIKLISAYDGQEALDIIEKSTTLPDIIFLDINMPGMDGHAFLQEYAKLKNNSIVVVMLTSSEQVDDKEKCSRYSFVKGYISKPLELENLIALNT